MAIPYRFLDFVPAVKEKTIFHREFETVQETVIRANAWIEESGVRVVNIETLMLEVSDREHGSEVSGPNDTHSHGVRQVIRVWYTTS